MMAWFGMGVHYGTHLDSKAVWPIFRDSQIACNGYARNARQDIDQILDRIRYGDHIVLKSFAPNVGLCVYAVGNVIGMNTYPFPIPEGYENQCLKLSWLLRSADDKYVQNFTPLVGSPYSEQLFEFPSAGANIISKWLNGIGIIV